MNSDVMVVVFSVSVICASLAHRRRRSMASIVIRSTFISLGPSNIGRVVVEHDVRTDGQVAEGFGVLDTTFHVVTRLSALWNSTMLLVVLPFTIVSSNVVCTLVSHRRRHEADPL